MNYILFKLNYKYHHWVSFEDKYNISSKSFLANELAMELKKLINVYYSNLLYVSDL